MTVRTDVWGTARTGYTSNIFVVVFSGYACSADILGHSSVHWLHLGYEHHHIVDNNDRHDPLCFLCFILT